MQFLFSLVWHTAVLHLNYLSIKLYHIYSAAELVFKSHREKHHLSQLQCGSNQRPEDCQYITADGWYLPRKYIRMYWCCGINRLYLRACSPLHHQTTRSRDRSMSCREGGRCRTRPGHMIPNQGKRMKEQGPDAKLQPLKQPLTGICAWFISPELRWGRTIMVIMMNWAIWMAPSSRVICELCATHRLMSSQNEPTRAQLRSWSSSGALPLSHEALNVQGTWRSVFNRVWWLVIGSFPSFRWR